MSFTKTSLDKLNNETSGLFKLKKLLESFKTKDSSLKTIEIAISMQSWTDLLFLNKCQPFFKQRLLNQSIFSEVTTTKGFTLHHGHRV